MSQNQNSQAPTPNSIDPGLVALRRAVNMARRGLAECTRCKKQGFMKSMAVIVLHNLPLGAICMDCAGKAILAATGEGGDLHVRVIDRDALFSPQLVAVRARDAIGDDAPLVQPDVAPFTLGEEE